MTNHLNHKIGYKRNLTISDSPKLILKGVLEKLFSKEAIEHHKSGNSLPKNNAAYLTKPLKLVFQTIVRKGLYPECWNLARVTPIF